MSCSYCLDSRKEFCDISLEDCLRILVWIIYGESTLLVVIFDCAFVPLGDVYPSVSFLLPFFGGSCSTTYSSSFYVTCLTIAVFNSLCSFFVFFFFILAAFYFNKSKLILFLLLWSNHANLILICESVYNLNFIYLKCY